jgi:hypothetical protein
MSRGAARRAALALLACAGLAGAAGNAAAEWSANLAVEHFRWAESTTPGVTETGPRVGLGVGWMQDRSSGWLFAYRGELYGGSVQYSGAGLFTGTPIEGTTDYYGVKNEVQAILRSAGGRANLILGLGLDYWERWLTNVQNENYWVWYLRAGAEYGGRASHGWFAGAGLKYPVYVEENAHLDDIGFDQNPKLHPGRAASGYAELGYRFGRRWSANAYYEGYRFGESRPATVTMGGTTFQVFQPKASADSFGLRLHYHI